MSKGRMLFLIVFLLLFGCGVDTAEEETGDETEANAEEIGESETASGDENVDDSVSDIPNDNGAGAPDEEIDTHSDSHKDTSPSPEFDGNLNSDTGADADTDTDTDADIDTDTHTSPDSDSDNDSASDDDSADDTDDVFILTCTSNAGVEVWANALEKLAAQYEKWKQNEPVSYEYQLENICFCPQEYTGPFKVTVQDSKIVDVLIAEWDNDEWEATGNWLSADLSKDAMVHFDPSIDALFKQVKQSLEGNTCKADITYDDIFGFVADVEFDISEEWVDEEWGATITGFKVLD